MTVKFILKIGAQERVRQSKAEGNLWNFSYIYFNLIINWYFVYCLNKYSSLNYTSLLKDAFFDLKTSARDNTSSHQFVLHILSAWK